MNCSMEMEAQREKRERDAWEREIRDIRELEFMEKMKHEMDLKLTGLCPLTILLQTTRRLSELFCAVLCTEVVRSHKHT